MVIRQGSADAKTTGQTALKGYCIETADRVFPLPRRKDINRV